MTLNDWYRYKSAIETANYMEDKDRAKEILRGIQADLISRFGLNDSDVEQLIRKFRYTV